MYTASPNGHCRICLQDVVHGKGNDDDKGKPAACRKRKSAADEQDVKEQAAAIDFKVHCSACCDMCQL